MFRREKTAVCTPKKGAYDGGGNPGEDASEGNVQCICLKHAALIEKKRETNAGTAVVEK